MILIHLYLTFLRIGAVAFGGGYAMIPLLRTEVIETHSWLTAAEFADLMSVAQITPGPIAVNSATFVGYRLGGVAGSAVATLAVITPSFLLILLLSRLLREYRESELVSRVFRGIKPQVVALIAAAALSIGGMAFSEPRDLLLAGVAGTALYVGKLSPITVIAICGAAGALLY